MRVQKKYIFLIKLSSTLHIRYARDKICEKLNLKYVIRNCWALRRRRCKWLEENLLQTFV